VTRFKHICDVTGRRYEMKGIKMGEKSLYTASLLALNTRFRYIIKDSNDGKNSLKSAIGNVRVFW